MTAHWRPFSRHREEVRRDDLQTTEVEPLPLGFHAVGIALLVRRFVSSM